MREDLRKIPRLEQGLEYLLTRMDELRRQQSPVDWEPPTVGNGILAN